MAAENGPRQETTSVWTTCLKVERVCISSTQRPTYDHLLVLMFDLTKCEAESRAVNGCK